MNYFTENKKAYKKEVKKVRGIIRHEDVHLSGKGIPKPHPIVGELKGKNKSVRVFKK